MSDKSPKRVWRFYIDDMIGFVAKVLSYTDSLDQDDFIYGATLRNLEPIVAEIQRESLSSNLVGSLWGGDGLEDR